MVIEEEKNVVKLICKVLSFFFNPVVFFVDIFSIKPRRWAVAVYLLFIFFPCSLQAAFLPTRNVGENSINIPSLVSIKANERAFNVRSFVKATCAKIEYTFSLNKWFSKFIGNAKEIILFIPYLCEYMSNIIYSQSAAKSGDKVHYIYGFHKDFLTGFIGGLVGLFLSYAQRLA